MADLCSLYPFICKSKKLLPGCSNCENREYCAEKSGARLRVTHQSNVVGNVFANGQAEVVYYEKPFEVLEREINPLQVDRARKFDNVSGVAVPKSDTTTIQDFVKSFRRSSHRSSDNFYGYALSNIWGYFVTLTFSPDKVNRYDDKAVKQQWSSWLDKIRKKYPNIKVLLVPERHPTSGCIHFHGFISGAEFTLRPAVFPKGHSKEGQAIRSRCGDLIFNILDWDNGFSTCCILPNDYNQRRVVNYCIKYITKESSTGYNQKRFYHTRNLLTKTKSNCFVDAEISTVSEYLADSGFVCYKANDEKGVYVFRQERVEVTSEVTQISLRKIHLLRKDSSFMC